MESQESHQDRGKKNVLKMAIVQFQAAISQPDTYGDEQDMMYSDRSNRLIKSSVNPFKSSEQPPFGQKKKIRFNSQSST